MIYVPIMQMYMYPLEEQSMLHKTQVVKKSLKPTYHEIFSVPLTDDNLRDGKLVVQVWDKDIMDHDDLIGEVVIAMESFDFSLLNVHTAWYTLRAQVCHNTTHGLVHSQGIGMS